MNRSLKACLLVAVTGLMIAPATVRLGLAATRTLRFRLRTRKPRASPPRRRRLQYVDRVVTKYRCETKEREVTEVITRTSAARKSTPSTS